jgi:hypothetical protein
MGDYRLRSMTFTFFDGPVAAVGGIMSQTSASEITLLALDILGNVIESAVTFVAPSADDNVGVFRGIIRNTSDIYGFRIDASNLVLDDLTFSRSTDPGVVPEPASMLTWCGLALAAYWGKTARRRA